jgi:hypothetical protein
MIKTKQEVIRLAVVKFAILCLFQAIMVNIINDESYGDQDPDSMR